MKTDESNNTDLNVEIQKTLISINGITLKIKNELDTIKELVKENGQLHAAMVGAKETLTKVAENMGINVEEILDTENEDDLQFNLKNVVSSADFQEKILAFINDT